MEQWRLRNCAASHFMALKKGSNCHNVKENTRWTVQKVTMCGYGMLGNRTVNLLTIQQINLDRQIFKENHKVKIFTPNLLKISIPSSKQGTASMCLIRTQVP